MSVFSAEVGADPGRTASEPRGTRPVADGSAVPRLGGRAPGFGDLAGAPGTGLPPPRPRHLRQSDPPRLAGATDPGRGDVGRAGVSRHRLVGMPLVGL